MSIRVQRAGHQEVASEIGVAGVSLGRHADQSAFGAEASAPGGQAACTGWWSRPFAWCYGRGMERRLTHRPIRGAASRRANVREVENVIQRAVILSLGGRLIVPPLGVECQPQLAADEGGMLEGVKRAAIVRVLEETRWVVGGPRGAAARLGVKRTTLQSMMKRFGLPLPRDAARSGVHGYATRPRHDENWAAG